MSDPIWITEWDTESSVPRVGSKEAAIEAFNVRLSAENRELKTEIKHLQTLLYQAAEWIDSDGVFYDPEEWLEEVRKIND